MSEKKVYIKASSCISAQETFDKDVLNLEKICVDKDSCDYILAKDPNFNTYIPAKRLRRICNNIRRGLLLSQNVLKKANIENPDAIIVGTGLGCIHETISFLNTMIKEKENFLNPSNFIQSTHNTIAGNIALMLGCYGYNMTFTQKNKSFESALLDSIMMLNQEEVNNVLLGGIDEIDTRVIDKICNLTCNKGKILGEGAAFFLLTNKKTEIELIFNPILNNIKNINIDVVIGSDASLLNNFPNAEYIIYKYFFGEFDTDIALAMWLGYNYLNNDLHKNCLIFKNESSILLKKTI